MITSHGHHIPGTVLNETPTNVARCGGPKICPACKDEARMGTAKVPFQQRARELVYNYIQKNLEITDRPISELLKMDDVYVVWSVKALQNWKCLLSTNLPDGMYYELTYDGDKGQTYFDAYKKFANFAIPDETV